MSLSGGQPTRDADTDPREEDCAPETADQDRGNVGGVGGAESEDRGPEDRTESRADEESDDRSESRERRCEQIHAQIVGVGFLSLLRFDHVPQRTAWIALAVIAVAAAAVAGFVFACVSDTSRA